MYQIVEVVQQLRGECNGTQVDREELAWHRTSAAPDHHPDAYPEESVGFIGSTGFFCTWKQAGSFLSVIIMPLIKYRFVI